MHSSRRKEGAFTEQEMKSLGHLLKSRTKRPSRKIEKKTKRALEDCSKRQIIDVSRKRARKKNKGGEDLMKEIVHKNAQK